MNSDRFQPLLLLFSLLFAFFIIAPAMLGAPFALAITIVMLGWLRRSFSKQPLSAFFFVGSLVAVMLFLIWGLCWGGLPEFSEVGLL